MEDSIPPTGDDRAHDTSPPWDRPKTTADLHAWLRTELGLVFPTRALIDGHAAPFDYLCHAFFDGGVPVDGAGLPQIDQRSPDCVVWANRGGGKTFLGAVATLLDLVFKPTIEIRILAGSLDQGRNMHNHLRALFDHDQLADMLGGRITERRIKLKNGSRVELLAQSQTSVRGTRVQKLRCDEVELFDSDVWEAAQLTTRSKRCGGVMVPGTIECLSTMHEPHGLMYRLVRETTAKRADGGPRRALFKWGVVDVLDRCDEAHDCGACSLADACGGRAKQRDAAGEPPGHISVDDARTLQSRVSKPTWAAEMLCLRPSRRDCVLPEFDPALHVIRGPIERVGEMVCGMDFGIRAPTVILWALLDKSGVLRIIGERGVAGVTTDRHADAIATGEPDRCAPGVAPLEAPAWVGVDPAGRQRSDQTGCSNVDVLRQAGLRVRDVKLRIAGGLELLRRRLAPASGEPTLFIHEACATLIESIERYRYPSDRPESTEPVKDGSDHAVDALRYLVQNIDAARTSKRGRYA